MHSPQSSANPPWLVILFSILEEDTLIEKITKPLETGGMMAGWLFFPVPGVSLKQLRTPATKVEITFENVYGHRCVAKPQEQTVGPFDVPTILFPGTSAPFTRPPD
jgi:hypothetical protein